MKRKTILITGTSSGIGRATAKYFQENDWNVVATMRSPEKETELTKLDNMLVAALDVTDRDSIAAAFAKAKETFGNIDCVVNNAGYGLAGPMEMVTQEQLERQYATNVYGPVYVMQAALPGFRENDGGLIINITSIGGRVALPFNSLYHGTKFALEGISESLNFELNPFGIRVKIVEPGGVRTDFSGRSMTMTTSPDDETYGELLQSALAVFSDENRAADYSEPELIARVIFEAATDGEDRVRYLAGEDAKKMMKQRNELSDDAYLATVSEQFGLNKKLERSN